MQTAAIFSRFKSLDDELTLFSCIDVPPSPAALSNMDYREPKLVVCVVATDHVPIAKSQR